MIKTVLLCDFMVFVPLRHKKEYMLQPLPSLSMKNLKQERSDVICPCLQVTKRSSTNLNLERNSELHDSALFTQDFQEGSTLSR